MTRTTIVAGILSVSALLISPSLIMDAQTGLEAATGIVTAIVGLVFAILFSAMWAQELDDRARRMGRRRPF